MEDTFLIFCHWSSEKDIPSCCKESVCFLLPCSQFKNSRVFHIHTFCGVLLQVLRFGNAWKWQLWSCAQSQGLCAPLCLSCRGLQPSLLINLPVLGLSCSWSQWDLLHSHVWERPKESRRVKLRAITEDVPARRALLAFNPMYAMYCEMQSERTAHN